MRKILVLFFAGLLLTGVLSSACFAKIKAQKTDLSSASSQPQAELTIVQPVDYSNKSNWMYMDTSAKHEVDLLYFYPTATYKAEPGYKFGAINDMNKKNAQFAFAKSGAAFSAYTNVFAPYYRQVPATALPNTSLDDVKKKIKTGQGKIDVFNALDYYFNNLNNGRPFMISSHSQGSFIMQLAFEEYFSKHPEYLNRMVAAYTVGIPITNKWLKKNHLKFVKGETDTGVIITWNTEGPNAIGGMEKNQLTINPINWKLDETPATLSENKGSLLIDMKKQTVVKAKGIADATINLNRGTVVCTTRNNYLPQNNLFGDKSFHIEDYTLYYENIKENGLKRIESYLGHKVK